MMLALKNINFSIKQKKILNSIYLDICQGEIVGILGRNGSGKSTLLEIVALLYPQYSGEILYQGQDIRLEKSDFRKHISAVFQNPSLDKKLSARENLNLAAMLYDLPKESSKKRIEELLKIAELHDRADEPIINFSGGMKRKLDVMRALLHKPKLLLLDEPTTGLDEAAFRTTWNLLHAMRQEDKELTILVATHRSEEAQLCDRLAIIDAGHFLFVDSPANLKKNLGKEVIFIGGENLPEIKKEIEEKFQLPVYYDTQMLYIDCNNAQELIPKIVSHCPDVKSIGMRPSSLNEVFLKITGNSLA